MNLVEAGVDAVDVAAQVVVVLPAVAVTVPVEANATLIVPTYPVGPLRHLPQMVTLIPPSRGPNSLRLHPQAPNLAGAPLQTPKLEHLDGPILAGVLTRLPMVQ